MTSRMPIRLRMRSGLAAGLVLAAACASARGGGTSGPEPIRIVSYNIRHGRGMDDRVDLARTAEVLRRLAPDIVALQEVDEGVERSGRADEAAELGRMLGMRHAFGSFFDYQGGRYGMAVLSRLPVGRVREVRLPDGNEPRIALAVEVRLPDGATATVVNVHFDWVADDSFRLRQAEVVAAFLDTLAGPRILIGDFNDTPGSRTLDLFARRLAGAPKPAADHFTFSSREPEKEIDHVFFGPVGFWSVRDVRVIEEPDASDHRPVVVVVARGPGGRE